MTRDEYLILATEYVDDITWANGTISEYEFLSTFYSSGGDLTPTATDLSGQPRQRRRRGELLAPLRHLSVDSLPVRRVAEGSNRCSG